MTSPRSNMSSPRHKTSSLPRHRVDRSLSSSPSSDNASISYDSHSEDLLQTALGFGTHPQCPGTGADGVHQPFSANGCRYCDALLSEAKQRLAVLQRERQREVSLPRSKPCEAAQGPTQLLTARSRGGRNKIALRNGLSGRGKSDRWWTSASNSKA